MRSNLYTREVDRIVENFGGTRRLHPNTWRIPIAASPGYLSLTTSSYRNTASIALDRDYINPNLDNRLSNELLQLNRPTIGGVPGHYWAVWGLDSATALSILPELLHSDLNHLEPQRSTT